MADSETETNPRKKIKTDHSPGQNGDHPEVAEIQKNTDLPQAESSQAISQGKEDIADVTESGVTKEKEETSNEDCNNEDDKPGETGKDNLKENTDTVKDTDSDDDMIDDRDAGRSKMDLSDAESDVSALSDMSSLSGEDSWKAAPAGPFESVFNCYLRTKKKSASNLGSLKDVNNENFRCQCRVVFQTSDRGMVYMLG
ncbi:serine-aspartate repeat-containing protein C-like [Mercenaria mercenaria]|uniref:serine-aspartate repeat-containing protein C-like n=1 Tax=Mercenaria mercenaria TaxID=6596 RepID=UPI00234F48B5|nr:serine-aspartate repeat-containing protein C-like [Mercenaria mercenaria]